MGIWFWCVSTILYHEFFSRAARGKAACRRLSTCGCGNFGSYTSGTGGWGFCFGVCQQFLFTMYISPGLREGNLFVGDSPPTVAAVLVCILAEREGGDFVLVCFQQLNSPRIGLPSCAGGTGLPAALYARLQRFLFAYKKNGRVGILFWCVSTFSYHVPFSRAARGEPACRRLSTHDCGNFCSHTRRTGIWVFVLVCFIIFIPCTVLPGCAGGTGLPAALYSRLRPFWFVYKRNRTVGIWFWHV